MKYLILMIIVIAALVTLSIVSGNEISYQDSINTIEHFEDKGIITVKDNIIYVERDTLEKYDKLWDACEALEVKYHTHELRIQHIFK